MMHKNEGVLAMRRKDHSGSKRGLALLLAVVMTLSLLPGAAFAADDGQEEQPLPASEPAVTALPEEENGADEGNTDESAAAEVEEAEEDDDAAPQEFQLYASGGEEAWNLAQGQPVAASTQDSSSTAAKAVDGNTAITQWSSGDMKTGGASADPNAAQTPQWLWVDLGYTGSQIDRIKLWYNLKVWPMVYEIQTSDDPGGTWDTVVRVERSPFAGAVKNGAGQDIADETGNTNPSTAANTDTITASSSPALQTTTLKRYVRIYIEKVNTSAPGNNTGLREVEIFGVNENRHPAVDVDALLAGATSSSVTANGSAVTLPAAPAGATLTVAGSTLENVVANDGAIGGKNIGPREVTLLVRAWDDQNPGNYQQKNLTVTVPDHKSAYPAAWFPGVSGPNAKPEVIPAIQEWYGYNGSFTLSASSRIVINDAANVGLTKVAANMKADLKEISGLDLPVVTGISGGANDIYIEAQTADNYDLGKEGYLMRVSDEGVKIYAPTYTGCIFGTITVEQILWQAADHLSVPRGIMRDYPAYEVRGVKLDVARTPYRYQQLKDYAKIMLWYKMSEYDLHINDNDNANIAGATMETHSGFHRLVSETFPGLAESSGTKHAGIPAALVNKDYYNNNPDYQGNPVYTKAQWRALEQLVKDCGMYLLTEIDLPGHSLIYNKYTQESAQCPNEYRGGTIMLNDDGSVPTSGQALELLDLTGDNAERALNLARALWDEYTSGTEPTIYGDIVHIGADEYWSHNADTNPKFALFADAMRQVIQGNLGADTKIRMWGASTTNFSTATTTLNKTHAELAEDFQLDVWSTGYDNPAQRAKEGYGIVNCRDAFVYGNPGRSGRDVPNAEYLFNNWNPTTFGGSNPLPGEPNLLGAKAVLWGDQSQEGMTERDIHQRVLRAIAIISEKTWGGLTHSEGDFSDYELRAARLAEGPGTEIAMKIPSKTSLVLDYDFKNLSSDGTTVFDQSGNGYNGTLNAAGTVDADGFLTFNGSTLLTTDLKTLSYPYTVSFDLKLDAGNNRESSLFSGYDGRIQAAGKDGKLSADVNYFTRDFNYTVPTNGTAVNITLVGTFQATRLYVDGRLVTFLSQKADNDGVASGNIQTLYSSVLLPLEKIGQDLHGKMANLKVYNKALSAAEIAGTAEEGLVNVAQNAIAGGGSPQGANDNNVQRVCIAAKAIDGEDFTDTAATDAATTEMWSYWRADSGSNSLTVDLGQTRAISRIAAHWRGVAPSSSFQTSDNGTAWTNFTNGAAVNARYVRVNATGEGNLQELLVYERVDKTDLADMLAQAEAAVTDRDADFESTGEDAALFEAVVFARAVQNSPLATRADVARAMEGLEPYADGPEPVGFTVTVPEEDITLIAAKVNWTAAEGAAGYTVTVTGEGHTGATDNVWYQDNVNRTAKLANLNPGRTYTVTVSGGGETASATFTTKTAANTRAEAAADDPEAPAPYGALPDDQQLYYHENDMASFIHFGPNTFNNVEWGSGNESPSDFDLAPGELTNDPAYGDRQIPVYVDQWVQELQNAGFQRLIMVAKHHDGFCLWDSEYTDHNVMASPYGRDLLWDVSQACTKYSMDMGFYFSPWDMHDSSYGEGKAYDEYYMNQLREVLGNPKYGNNGVFVETWMDGAKGSGKPQEYDFDSYFKLIKELQPECLIYTDRADGGVRWSGNEVGSTGANADGTGAGDMCWQTMDVATKNYEGVNTPGMMEPWKSPKWQRQRGQENGVIWSVCECDVSIENGWFGKDNNSVRSLESLLEMYLSSAGYGSPFLLNLPPIKTGYFRDASSQRLAELGKAIRDTFRTDMLQEEGYTVTATANKTRASAAAGKFGAANVIDGDPDTYWTMDDGQTTGAVTISLGGIRTFDVVTLKEYIPLGQRIKAGKVEYHDESGWHDFSTFTTIGAKRIMRTEPVKGDQIRVTITGSNAVPLLSAVEVYKARSGMELGDGIPDGVVYVDDQAAGEIQYSASGWTTRTGKDFISQTNTYANNAASFTYTFAGSKMYVMGIKDTGNGRFRVKMDDGEWTEVNTADTVSRQIKTILWASDDLTDGTHTLSLEWVSGWFDFDGLCYLPSGKSMVEFEKSSYNVFPNGEVELKIVRSGDTSVPATFKIVDLPSTAVQGQHYVPLTKEIAMGAGVTETTIRVQVLEGTSGNAAAGRDFSMAITDCRDPNTTVIGFHDEAVIYIVDPDTVPQEPRGEAYTEQDPFNFPAQVGKIRKLEAEYMVLDGSGAASGNEIRISGDENASGGKKLGWFEPNNKAYLHYYAAKAGIYTMTLRYQSGRPEGDLNKLNWRGEKTEDHSGTIPSTLSGTTSVYSEESYRFVVNEPGHGMLEFYADASGCPNIDWFTFRLDSIAISGVAISGTAKAGQRLTATVTPAEATAAYQWYRVDEDGVETAISGATGFQYTLTAEDVGKTVFVKATGTGDFYRTVTSTPTAEVAKAPPTVGGSSDSRPTTTTVETREDGTEVVVVIKPDGTVIETVEKPDGTVEAVATYEDGTVTITVTDPEGKKVEKVTTPDQDMTITVTDPQGEVLAEVKLPAEIAGPETKFVDVPEGHWAEKSINAMAGLGVVNGVGEDHYGLMTPMTRGSVATVLYRLSNGKNVDFALEFADVDKDGWYADGVSWAARNGVVKGIEGVNQKLFWPNDVISREQLAVMLTRYAKLLGMSTRTKDMQLDLFADGGNTSTWAVDGVAWCVEKGILQGKGGGVLDPRAEVSRAEAAIMLERFLDLLK